MKTGHAASLMAAGKPAISYSSPLTKKAMMPNTATPMTG